MTSSQNAIRAVANEARSGPDALYPAAIALWREGRRDEAVKVMDEALRQRSDFAEALCMGGYMLSECGKPEPAMRFYRRALELDASLVVAHLNLGKLLFAAGRFPEALASFSEATILAPHDADAWCSRAGALRELGRLEESVQTARRALELRHDFPEAAINLGNALLKLDRSAEALEAYLQASAPGPCQAKALLGQGLALRSLGRFSEAMAAFDAAAALGSREAISGKGCLMLTLGDFENGLEGYEARWLKGKSIAEALGTRFETWKDRGRKGERVLVLNDHGLGDTIQFFRYLPLMAAAGVESTFVCPPRLRRLLSSKTKVRFADNPPEGEPFDAQIAISSLPYAFGTRLETIPAAVPYLAAEPALRAMWLKRIGAEGFKIGVVWQGNLDPEADTARSIPLTALAPLAEVPGVRLISLQKGAGQAQLPKLPPSMRVEAPGAALDAGGDAFVDTAAVMTCLDLIITCDTSAAHLAGALAVPVWVALKSDAEWRWLTERTDSPWYPTMRLFRQSRQGVWADVFEAMAYELAQLTERRTASRILSTPCSLGELIDKITILRIKAERIQEPQKLANVHRELKLLERRASENGAHGSSLDLLTDQLAHVNARLWTIEDALRECEREGDFGARFIALARSVYCENDTRAAIKRAINTLMSSALVEEKSYA
ncbi:MAG: glycosyltransferase family protein [Hyphomicrobiales bacterium]|nr:glycosyltransferase family protein [Hyphomicrobiales bacterium]